MEIWSCSLNKKEVEYDIEKRPICVRKNKVKLAKKPSRSHVERACREGDADEIRSMFDDGDVDLDSVIDVENQETALHVTCRYLLQSKTKGLEVIQMLVGRGASLRRGNAVGDTALHLVCQRAGNLVTAKFLVSRGGDILALNSKGESSLRCAFDNYDIATACFLAESATKLTSVDHAKFCYSSEALSSFWEDAFILASLQGTVEVAIAAVQNGADIRSATLERDQRSQLLAIDCWGAEGDARLRLERSFSRAKWLRRNNLIMMVAGCDFGHADTSVASPCSDPHPQSCPRPPSPATSLRCAVVSSTGHDDAGADCRPSPSPSRKRALVCCVDEDRLKVFGKDLSSIVLSYL